MKICNLDYMKSHSINNPKFVVEMINMLLTQTPAYITEMRTCLYNANWKGLQGNSHKIRPSIDMIGMPKEIGAAAKQIEENSRELTNLDLIPDLFLQVENAFHQAYIELEEELIILKNNGSIIVK